MYTERYPVRSQATANAFVRAKWGANGRAMHYPACGTYWYVLGFVKGDNLVKMGIGDSWQAAFTDYEKRRV